MQRTHPRAPGARAPCRRAPRSPATIALTAAAQPAPPTSPARDHRARRRHDQDAASRNRRDAAAQPASSRTARAPTAARARAPPARSSSRPTATGRAPGRPPTRPIRDRRSRARASPRPAPSTGRSGSTTRQPRVGICGYDPKPGDSLLFFPDCYGKKCPKNAGVLGIKAAAVAVVGRPFAVSVTAYSDAKGTPSRAAGATVSGGGASAKTGAGGSGDARLRPHRPLHADARPRTGRYAPRRSVCVAAAADEDVRVSVQRLGRILCERRRGRGGARPRAAAASAPAAPRRTSSLLVTQAFGAQTVLAAPAPKIVGADTVMRMLERNARVGTRYGGGFVQSIDGLAGGGGSDWFYYVNGVQALKGAAATKLTRRRPRLVGPPRLERDADDARRSSAPSPSRSSTASAASACRCLIECTRLRSPVVLRRRSARSPATTCSPALGCLLCSPYNRVAARARRAVLDADRRPRRRRAGAARSRPAASTPASSTAGACSRCSTRTGASCAAAPAARPRRGDALHWTSRRSGSSPAPTPPASPPRCRRSTRRRSTATSRSP